MTTFNRRGLTGQVATSLGQRIMAGELPPASALDPEAVAAEFSVSRTVVREAMKTLIAKGLVRARPKLGTFVADRGDWQLLDADVMEWRIGDRPDPRLVVELDEIRTMIEPSAARLAAERGTAPQRARIQRATDRLEATYVTMDADSQQHIDADLEFHRSILAAAGNELLEQLEVVLAPALKARDDLAYRHIANREFLRGHRAVCDAIAARSGEDAHAAMVELMSLSARDSRVALRKSLSRR